MSSPTKFYPPCYWYPCQKLLFLQYLFPLIFYEARSVALTTDTRLKNPRNRAPKMHPYLRARTQPSPRRAPLALSCARLGTLALAAAWPARRVGVSESGRESIILSVLCVPSVRVFCRKAWNGRSNRFRRPRSIWGIIFQGPPSF